MLPPFPEIYWEPRNDNVGAGLMDRILASYGQSRPTRFRV